MSSLVSWYWVGWQIAPATEIVDWNEKWSTYIRFSCPSFYFEILFGNKISYSYHFHVFENSCQLNSSFKFNLSFIENHKNPSSTKFRNFWTSKFIFLTFLSIYIPINSSPHLGLSSVKKHNDFEKILSRKLTDSKLFLLIFKKKKVWKPEYKYVYPAVRFTLGIEIMQEIWNTHVIKISNFPSLQYASLIVC